MNIKILAKYINMCEEYGFEPNFECLKKFKELQNN